MIKNGEVHFIINTPSGKIPRGGTCMYEHGNISGWVVQNNFMHDVGWCVSFQYDSGPSNGVTISGNQIYNIDHAIALGGPSASQTLENVKIHDNYIHDYSNWDDPADNWHHDGIHIWGDGNSGTDTITNVWIYNNKFGGCIGAHVTAHIFIEANSGGTTNVYGFNNVLTDTCNGTDNDGMITTGQDGGAKWYNNTVQSISTNSDVCVGTSSSPNVTYINNVASGCTQGLMYLNGGSVISGGLHNNIYAAGPGNCASGGDDCWRYGGNNWQGTFSTWQSQTGQDASPSAYVTSANLTSSGVPNSGSPVLGVGANLTSLCTGNLAPLCLDINGNARPSSGAWDIGAYEGSGGTTFTLSTATAGTGSGTITGCAGSYAASAPYSCTVSASGGSTLTSVTGCGGSGTTTYAGTMPGSNCTVTATFQGTAATPTFLPVAGVVSNPTTITASTATTGDGCTMYFDTSNPPTTAQTTYSVTTAVTLYAQAKGCSTHTDSAVGSAAYTITVPVAATPTFSPVAGTYSSAQTVTITSADAHPATNAQNSLTGWETCILLPCDPGGTGVPTSTALTIGHATPSLSGASMLTSLTADVNDTNALFYWFGTDCDSCTNFDVDYKVNPLATAGLGALEYDQFQFNVALNTEFMWGMQYCFNGAGCPGGHSSWDIFDQLHLAWIDTGITTAPNLGAWNHFQAHNHRVVGDTNSCSGQPCMHYDNFSLNGTLYTLNLTEPAGTLPSGWTSGDGFQIQMDVTTVSGSTTYTEYLDQANFSETPATLYYTTDGSTPTTGSTVYSAPITVSTTQTVKAIAAVAGYTNSAVGSAAYTITVPVAATPTFSPVAGTYSSAQTVTISDATAGSTIYYTTNGSTPTTGSTVYSTPITVGTTQTVKAIAAASGYTSSAVGSALYTINLPAAATPTFSPAGGTYGFAQTVTISDATGGATVYYTTDGSTPTTGSTVYSTPLTVSTTQTVKALAAASGHVNSSVGSATYTISIAPAPPASLTGHVVLSGAVTIP